MNFKDDYHDKSYCYNVAVGFDCFVNALLKGSCRETLSSRCWRNSTKYWYARALRHVLDFIFRPFENDHCYQSYLYALRHGDCPKVED